MNVLILGSTGASGKEIIKKLLEKEHAVTALARDPSKLDIKDERLFVFKGNVLEPGSWVNHLDNKDAVISALGVGKSLKSKDLISKSVDIVLPAMKEKNIKRLIFLSAFGVGETYKQASFIQKFVFGTFLKNLYADKKKADEKIMQSGLEWTLVYPVLLTNKQFSGSYKTGEKLPMKGMPKLTRADLADFIVGQLTDRSYIRKSPVIMN